VRVGLVGGFLFADQFYDLSFRFVQKKIVDSVLFTKQLGAKVVGLGESISPSTAGGKWLVKKVY